MHYVVVIEEGEGSVGAWLPALPGCIAVGATRDEVMSLIVGAVEMHLEGMRDDGETVPTLTPELRFVDAA